MNILALDLGTSSVRGMVLDPTCTPVPGALVRRRTAVATGRSGAATLDGPSYLAHLVNCLDELTAAGHLDGVGLVAASAQWHSVLPVDRARTPIGPALTWLDTRPTPSAEGRGPLDDDDFHQRTGTWWHRLYWTVRLPWLREWSGTEPAAFTGLVEYLYGVLLDEAPMSVSQASGTGLLDLRTLDWDPEACELAGVRSGELPALAPRGWAGQLRADYARRWPALRTARWAEPAGDGAASNVGSHCVDTSRVAVTVGTSAGVRLVQPAPAAAPLAPLPYDLWRYRVDHERIVTGVAYSAGGNLFLWANRALRLPEGKDLDAAMTGIPPGAAPPADTRLGGDRPPGQAPPGSGRLCGIGFGTTAVEILASLMDGVCRDVAVDLPKIEALAGHGTEVVLGGGAIAASLWWRQAFGAALAPRAVYHVIHPEVGAIGAALLATGLCCRCDDFRPIERPTVGEYDDNRVR